MLARGCSPDLRRPLLRKNFDARPSSSGVVVKDSIASARGGNTTWVLKGGEEVKLVA